MRVVFAGTPEFSVPCLEILGSNSEVNLVGVFTQPDRPSGRGREIRQSEVKQLALKMDLPIFQPESFKNTAAADSLKSLHPDLMVVVAYGLILSDAVLEIPRLGCVNIHASLLPRWRGAAPIQRAIEAGDKITGVTLMRIQHALDSGPILSQDKVEISDEETGGSLHDKLSVLGAQLLNNNIDIIKNDTIHSKAQNEKHVTYAEKLRKNESTINWQLGAQELQRKIHAFNPWLVATTELDGNSMRILKASCSKKSLKNLENLTNFIGQPGEVISADKHGVLVQTGKGQINLEVLQRAGGKPMDATVFLNGLPIDPGSIFR